MFRRYCIQNVKDGIQIQVYNINDESVGNFSQFISVEVKKNLRKSEAQFREKLWNLRLKQNDGFLIKERVCLMQVLIAVEFLKIYLFVLAATQDSWRRDQAKSLGIFVTAQNHILCSVS